MYVSDSGNVQFNDTPRGLVAHYQALRLLGSTSSPNGLVVDARGQQYIAWHRPRPSIDSVGLRSSWPCLRSWSA